MSRINTIKKALQEKGIAKYKIIETVAHNVEQYYVLGKLETVRMVDATIDTVTIFKEMEKEGKKLLGSAVFKMEHQLSKNEIFQLIDEANYSCSFVENEYYELVKGTKKKKINYKPLEESPIEILNKIGKIFIEESKDDVKFNSLELFFKEKVTHIINSENVDYEKKTFEINCEAIPSYNSVELKTELYRMFVYDVVDYNKVRADVKGSIIDIYNRGKAQTISNVKNVNVILHDKDILQMFDEVISSFSYNAVYQHANLKSIDENVQDKPKCALTLSLEPSNKADFFDGDGVLLKKHTIVEKGVLKSYYGSNRFGQYLNVEPTGMLNKISIKKGTKSFEDMKKKPYIEIFDLSGIQVDSFANYIGGEVRLGLYFDGKNTYPISGFSFSANLQDALNNLVLSKDVSKINNYEGPKYCLLNKVEVN